MSKREFAPHPGPQSEFMSSDADIAIYGGAAGGGKSYALLLDALSNTDLEMYTAVVFRRTIPQIRAPGSLWDVSSNIYPHFEGKARDQYLEWRFPSGAVIKFSHLQYETDKKAWDGSQLAFIGFDELTHFSESQFFYLLGRNRTTCGLAPYIRATCNPKRSSWVRKLIDWWIGPDGFPIKERCGQLRWFIRSAGELIWVEGPDSEGPQGQKPKSLTFIAASVEDNPTLMNDNPEYVDTLNALEEHERDRLLYGNWDVQVDVAGRIYAEFDAKEHFLSHPYAEQLEKQHIRDMTLYECWDFGSGATSATVVLYGYYSEVQDTLFLWDMVMDYEKPFEWYAEEISALGYYTKCKYPHQVPFADNIYGIEPYERIGDPAGRQRSSDQKSWFTNLDTYCGIDLRSGQNKPKQAIQAVKLALRQSKILLHPRMKFMGDVLNSYKWNVPDGFDPTLGVETPANLKPKKDWASHPADTLGYMVLAIWGEVGSGYMPL